MQNGGHAPEQSEFTLSLRERAGVRVYSERDSSRGHRQLHECRYNVFPGENFTLTLSLSQRERAKVLVLGSRPVI
jgi:hypothetical protein